MTADGLRKTGRWAASLWGSLQPARDTLPGGYRGALFALLAAAFVLRLGLAWALPNIHQADEVYQVAEQAHESIRGYGIVPWEFQTASRPAFFAALVTPIYRLNASPAVHQVLAAALFAALSLIPVWVAFQWVGRLYGIRAGLLAGTMMASWFELVYFAPKGTADIVGAEFFLAAVFLGRPGQSARGVFLAAFTLMLALGIRMQILPAVLVVLVLIALVHGRRRGVPLAAGAAAALALVGGIEWIWWGAPFRGHWGYLTMEFAHHASDFFGRQPPTFFAKNYVLIYGGTLPIIAALVYAGARKAPILLLALVALILPFHFVGHKEYRFVVVGVPVMVLLMGIGVAELLAALAPLVRSRASLVFTGGWLLAMVAMSLGDTYRPFWTSDRNHILAFREVGGQPDACGVALYRIRWWHTPGYSGEGRDIPIYEMMSAEDVARLASAANYILAAPKSPPPPAPYVRWREYSRPVEYLYRRPGGCAPNSLSQVRRPPIPVGGQ